jgi:hypothetical protein
MSESKKVNLDTRDLKRLSIKVLKSAINMNNKDEKKICKWIDQEGNTKTGKIKVIFLTSAGVITGDIPDTSEFQEGQMSSFADLFYEMFNLQESQQKVITPEEVIRLINVEIKTNAGVSLKFNEFMVFTEDIVAFYFQPSEQSIL